ncbi:branched-chain amino acid ABC transporter permease [Parafrigoribacterium mesophilum]|uniref:branched-chain amino acid ABC transporter permease n=1 Tax=Parafrigoribacterium mesophilum TaxID=433646 RepID=UPI0031FC3CC9
MNQFLTYLVSGIALGASFALIGSGFVVVHRVTRVVNFAQGSLAVFGGLISYSLLSGILPQGLGQVVTVIICAAIGLLMGVIAIGKRGTPPMISLLVTLGLAILSGAVVILLWGQDPLTPPGIQGSIQLFGAQLETQRLLVIIVTAVTFVLMSLFFGKTYLGMGLTASASNPRAARLVGINVRRMGFVSFAVAGALGGLAGVLIAPTNPVSFYSDLELALSGFAAAVFGGLNSPLKTAIGGLVLGVTGQLVAGFGGGSYQTQVALLMMLIVMIARHRSLAAEEAK